MITILQVSVLTSIIQYYCSTCAFEEKRFAALLIICSNDLLFLLLRSMISMSSGLLIDPDWCPSLFDEYSGKVVIFHFFLFLLIGSHETASLLDQRQPDVKGKHREHLWGEAGEIQDGNAFTIGMRQFRI